MKPIAETREARYTYDRIFTKRGPPQGISEEQFERISNRLRERLKQEAGRTGDFGEDMFVHGSRGCGAADSDADLDIGIRVTAERFDQLVQDRLARVIQGGDKWETLQEAVRQDAFTPAKLASAASARRFSG